MIICSSSGGGIRVKKCGYRKRVGEQGGERGGTAYAQDCSRNRSSLYSTVYYSYSIVSEAENSLTL